MHYVHPHTLQELALLRAAQAPDEHVVEHRRRRRERRRNRVRRTVEHPTLRILTLDRHEVELQLAHGGR